VSIRALQLTQIIFIDAVNRMSILKKSEIRPYEEAERVYENAVASRYNRDYHEAPIMQWQSENFVKFVTQFYQAGDRVLDLGCGPASLWPYWQNSLVGVDKLIGVDLSQGMIDEAKLLFPDSDFRVGSFFNIPAESGSFDVVIVSSAFHHIPDVDLPSALAEISRVLDEHGILIGREPLACGRIGDRGGWVSGALMTLRHLIYRRTHTREYPEPDAGPAHHAYDAAVFFNFISKVLDPVRINFRNPVSQFLARVRHPIITKIAKLLDESIEHREGQEVFYAARKNYATAEDVLHCVRSALEENHIHDIEKFLALVEASAKYIESELPSENKEFRR